MEFAQKLAALMEERGWTQYRLAKLLDVSQSTVAHWLAGDTIPQKSTLKRLAQLFDVEPFHFGTTAAKASITPTDGTDLSVQAMRIATLYDLADERDRKVVDLMLQKYETQLSKVVPLVAPKKPKEQPHRKMRRDGFEELDVYDQPSAAGFGNYLDVPAYQKQQYPAGIIPAATSFGILISGDSMEPKIHNRSTAFVQAVPAIDHGEIGIFVLNGQSYCKQLIIDRKKREVRLHSLNDRYDDIVIGEHDDLRTIGRVLGSYPK